MIPMRFLKFTLAATLAISGPIAAAGGRALPVAQAAAANPLSPVEIGVSVFNSFHSANRLFLTMKVGASTKDEIFLDSLNDTYKAVALPNVSVKDGAIIIQGLEKPFKVENLNKSLFSYGGKNIDVTMKDGIEQGFDAIEKIVFPRTTGWWSWLVPEAHAMFSGDPMVGVAAVAGVLGVITAANSCFEGPSQSAVGCGIGGFVTGGSLAYILTKLLGNDSPSPSQMTCYPGSNGCQQVVLMGPGRVPVNTISQCPGQAYNYSPALRQVPAATGQYMATQLTAMCPYPGTMASLNTAYAAPNLIPLQGAPPGQQMFMPYSTRIKPNSTVPPRPPASKIRPATAFPRPHQPQDVAR